VVTVIGKAFYDIDHSGKNPRKNRRNYDSSLAVWEIHPVMVMETATRNRYIWRGLRVQSTEAPVSKR
jgi:hypothetical protein